MTVPPQVRHGFEVWARERRQWLAPAWEYPATVWCAACGEPVTLTMSSSVDPAATLHGRCWEKRMKETK